MWDNSGVSLRTWISERSCRDVLLESCFSCNRRGKRHKAWETLSNTDGWWRRRTKTWKEWEPSTDSADWCDWKHSWRLLNYWRAAGTRVKTIAREAGSSPAHLHTSELAWSAQKKNQLCMFGLAGELRWALVSHKPTSVFLAEPDADNKNSLRAEGAASLPRHPFVQI